MRNFAKIAAAAIVVSSVFAGAASAATVNGLTFSAATDCLPSSTGNHFHSNSAGIWGNPVGKAEVGNFVGTCTEEVRGLSEFDLTGLSATTEGLLSFDIYSLGGLFAESDDPFLGWIRIVAYVGNNEENLSDFQAAQTALVGRLNTSGLSGGDSLVFDITDLLNDAILAGDSSLGIRLERGRRQGGQAITFDEFRLSTVDEAVASVPLPAGLPLLLAALGGLGFTARRGKT